MSVHVIEALFNNGWPDKPAWKVACSCGWEAWDRPTESEVMADFDNHLNCSEHPLGVHVIDGQHLLDTLRRVAAGEDPDLVYAELWANAEREQIQEGEQ